eukprot:9503887-Pyramimonas_sp.AAC.1
MVLEDPVGSTIIKKIILAGSKGIEKSGAIILRSGESTRESLFIVCADALIFDEDNKGSRV